MVKIVREDNTFSVTGYDDECNSVEDLLPRLLIKSVASALEGSLERGELTLVEADTMLTLFNEQGVHAAVQWIKINHPELVGDDSGEKEEV